MTKSKRFRVSQQDAASPVKASATETVIDQAGNEVEVTRDLSGGNGADSSGASTTGDANADAPQPNEASGNVSETSAPSGATGSEATNPGDGAGAAPSDGDHSNAPGTAHQAQSGDNPANSPESDLTGGAGNATSPARDANDKRDFRVLNPVRLDNVRHGLGKVLTLDRDQHGELARLGVVAPDWDEDEIGF